MVGDEGEEVVRESAQAGISRRVREWRERGGPRQWMRRARGGEGGAGRRQPILGAWRSDSAQQTDRDARATRVARQRAGTGRGKHETSGVRRGNRGVCWG